MERQELLDYADAILYAVDELEAIADLIDLSDEDDQLRYDTMQQVIQQLSTLMNVFWDEASERGEVAVEPGQPDGDSQQVN